MKEDNMLLTESIKRYRWKVGPWNDCSKPCNIGTKRRAVACYDTRGNKAMISEWICKRISRKPKDQMPCNRKPCQLLKPETNGQWIKGEWSKCSVTCDKVRFSPDFMEFGLGIMWTILYWHFDLYFKRNVIWSLVLFQGIQSRSVSCVSQATGQLLSHVFCEAKTRPDRERLCPNNLQCMHEVPRSSNIEHKVDKSADSYWSKGNWGQVSNT